MNSVVSAASLASATAVGSPSIAASTPADDPIYALIERHRAMIVEIETSDWEQDQMDAACEVARKIEDQIRVEVPCITPQGAAAALRYVAGDELEGLCDNKPVVHFMQRVADAIDRMIVPTAASSGEIAARHLHELDRPIFELARKHEAAVAAYHTWKRSSDERRRALDLGNPMPEALRIRRGETAAFPFLREGSSQHGYWSDLSHIFIDMIAKCVSPTDGKELEAFRVLTSKQKKRLREIARAAQDHREQKAATDYSQRYSAEEDEQYVQWLKVRKIEQQLARIPAKTVQGLQQKMRCATWEISDIRHHDQMDDALIISVLKDVSRGTLIA